MYISSFRFLALASAVFGAVSLQALTWEKSSQELALAAGAAEAVVEYSFKNESASAVTITELKSSCGCSVPTVAERVVPAGGAGRVRVVYQPGDRTGPQSAQLTVTTDEKGAKPATLLLRVNIEPAVVLTPRLVRWTGGDVSERVVEIKQAGGKTVKVLEVTPVSEALSVELRDGEGAGHWKLVMKPKAAGVFTAKVNVKVEADGRVKNYAVFGVAR